MRTLRLTAGLAMLLLMTACAKNVATEVAPPSPTASFSSEQKLEPTPEPTFDSRATTAVIFGTRVEFRNASGDVVDTVSSASKPAEFLSHMEEHFGAADDSFDDGMCAYRGYGGEEGLVVMYWSDGSNTPDLFVRGSEVNGIRIETPSGVSIGEDATDLVASSAPELKFEYPEGSGDWLVVYDVAGWWGPKQYGARASVEGGTLTRIMFPAHVGTMHGIC